MPKDKDKKRITITIRTLDLNEIDGLTRDDVLTRSQFILVAIKEKIEKEKARREIKNLKS